YGFVDGVNHSTGALNAFANPYAAMPSLHAADALIVGWFLFHACRRWWSKAIWALWPAWVWFCVMATANHYLVDVVAGIAVGAVVFVIGSVLDILDGALARAGGKSTPFGAFLDSTTDRVGEGAMLAAIGLVLAREGNDIAVVFTVVAVAGSFLVPYVRAKAEALGLRGDVGLGS